MHLNGNLVLESWTKIPFHNTVGIVLVITKLLLHKSLPKFGLHYIFRSKCLLEQRLQAKVT